MGQATPTVQVDNERCIVTRWDFKPGEETGVHVHGHDYCIVPVTQCILTIVDPNGDETTARMKEGESYYRQAGVHHNVINNTTFDFSFVEIEFK